jgi:hypothetical protein
VTDAGIQRQPELQAAQAFAGPQVMIAAGWLFGNVIAAGKTS